MPSKPGRYGIKFWILADAENHYCYNAFPYLGNEGDKIATNLGATVVKKLVEPIHNTSRNITCDRYFTDVELFEHLLKVKLTYMLGQPCLIVNIYLLHLLQREIVKLILLYLLLKILNNVLLGSKKRKVSASFVNPSSNQ